ncbi:hypothetical protein [Sulfuriferula nivalis]|uniref:Uncharacterized protein n=1 Tax=Sulfuriferula nivalis TaxID=2675298 RepID=A0A809S8U0_9PROT|nr:hypothetical protein [Sulfuriferula nivalis]BBP00452.1 hypothetical protein SFSGTM_11600 [Sulfuriferula nivalis]
MHKLFIALLATSAVLTSGCATTAKTTAPAPAVAAAVAPVAKPAPTLSVDAQAALAEAKSYVAAAQAKNALWTKTADALKAAEAAAKEVNDAEVIKNAKFATETAQVSIEQLSLPSTEHFKK